LNFALTGLLSAILTPLAKAKISIFSISTFDTEDIMLKQANRDRAIEVLKKHFDVFAAIIHEVKTGEKLPWWHWAKIRKAKSH
jgi:hypothetical protein